jgi:hypothetical protein
MDLVSRFPDEASAQSEARPLLQTAIDGDRGTLERKLYEEMLGEKEKDRHHWEPLKRRLAELRQQRRERP